MKKPSPLPTDLSYVPADSTPYRVTNSDSWYSLAERPDVKASGMSASDLCYFNFKTTKPSEINWYLYNKVGCRTSTKSGKNFMFSNGDSPGIVYLPKIGAPPPPVNEIIPKKSEYKSNAWIGLGTKVGTQFFVIGIETLGGYVVSLDDIGKGMKITSSINRVGPGFGASGGLCVIYVTGVSNPQQLNGHQQGDWDFNVALGGNWGKMAKAASASSKMQPIISAILKIGAKTPAGFKKALAAHPDKWVELVKAGKSVNEFSGIDVNGSPNVFIFDVPLGGGVEASAFYGLSNFNAFWDFD
jgi:hypothetical protein